MNSIQTTDKRIDGSRASAYVGLGRYDEAIQEQQTVVRLSDNSPSAMGSLAQIYARGGRTEEARKILEELFVEARTRYLSPGVFASMYFELGERDEALRWVERAYRERSNYVAYIAIDDSFDAVRRDPRYLNLLRRIGLQ